MKISFIFFCASFILRTIGKKIYILQKCLYTRKDMLSSKRKKVTKTSISESYGFILWCKSILLPRDRTWIHNYHWSLSLSLLLLLLLLFTVSLFHCKILYCEHADAPSRFIVEKFFTPQRTGASRSTFLVFFLRLYRGKRMLPKIWKQDFITDYSLSLSLCLTWLT